MVYRVYVEKKKEFAHEAAALLQDAKGLLGIGGLESVRVVNRYDAENITRELFDYAVKTVFSEPQVDTAGGELQGTEGAAAVFATEYLPGQFDQRADSAAQCIQIISRGERPLVRSAKVYILEGTLTENDIKAFKKYVINPVEAREADLALPDTLKADYDIPETVKTLQGFTELDEEGLKEFISAHGLAMDAGDAAFCRDYFRSERRDPTITEIKMIDTYWSDHCRHTTFLTHIDSVKFEDELLEKTYAEYLAAREETGAKKPVCLMDVATAALKLLKKRGMLKKLDESEEINACTVKIEIEADGKKEPWLLLFKNETHNHPTEIEPFGGAATCIGGAIRDPLSGRSYVYGAMRVTGAADPLVPVSETIPGKLPQRKIVTTAAAGYSSYGNQIGLATGIVDEIYHPGYAAKRMEIGAVIAAAPAENVRRERPVPGDVVILLGGATGRDGIGGATGSSKAHNAHSVETCGAEVQKGNAPEERKLQRLFRNPEASKLIKRCNDFGAGGVSVAIGELADGLKIDLNAVPRKYEGLDGTELAISESQERMAVVVGKEDEKRFLELAAAENLRACRVAEVTEDPRLTMFWNGRKIVDISREFLNSNGAEKHITIAPKAAIYKPVPVKGSFAENMRRVATDLNTCSKRGLSERFDSTIGAGTVLMPFGGKCQMTPAQAMVQKISVEKKHTCDCSLMAFGFNPFVSEQSPYHGAYFAVIESVSKLIASGASFNDVYLTFQEYFEKPGSDPKRWGKPLAALLGAFKAQTELGIASVGGKDSMSGSFEKLDVPPTLVSFAVTTEKTQSIVSPEFKKAGHSVYFLLPEYDENGLPETGSFLKNIETVTKLTRSGKAVACYTPGMGGAAEAVMKMAFGNALGFDFSTGVALDDLFGCRYGSFVIEVENGVEVPGALLLGKVTDSVSFTRGNEHVPAAALLSAYEGKLEPVYPAYTGDKPANVPNFAYNSEKFTKRPGAVHAGKARPVFLIPAFPGTNCEYDSAKAVEDAGGDARIFVVRNLTAGDIKKSVEDFAAEVRNAQAVFIPGGFSGGDEPDGSGKFITAFFRNPEIKDAVGDLLDTREGLMCGICNGFQALIKLGLVPFGKITDADENSPTLTFNTIGRHQSRIVRTRICSVKSPWLSLVNVGDVISVPISHGEGRFIADPALIEKLAANGQIATQYADLDGNATEDIRFNPNGSMFAVEGITSPDGRVFGKMGHSERTGKDLYKNVPGNYDLRMFEAAVKYFKG
ncbi:MAG: phosphoribosylformylglycinamidine synthase [Clostridia bacterium]|nr:phosphoribosylformylglycinamidine synthase [Clostridia bacterium]